MQITKLRAQEWIFIYRNVMHAVSGQYMLSGSVMSQDKRLRDFRSMFKSMNSKKFAYIEKIVSHKQPRQFASIPWLQRMFIWGRNKTSVVLPVLFITITLKAFSQDYSYINYDTRDGLAGSVVYDAVQDKEGFMWFATENGLTRFDGRNFKTFTTKDGLPDNEVLKLFVDSKGRVWIMPFKPSLCYYFKGKIYNKTNDSLLARISLRTWAFDMAEDRSGNFVVATESAFHVILKNGMVRKIDKVNNIPVAVLALGLNKFQEAELLLTVYSKPDFSDASYLIVFPVQNKTERIKVEPHNSEISKCQVTPEYLLISRKMDSTLLFYEGSTLLSTRIPSNTVSVNYINNRRIIINTTTGMKFFDPQTQRLSELFFKDFSVSSACQDKEDNLWLTTAGSGVLMVPSFQFKNLSFSEDEKSSEITALYHHGDTLYAGGRGNKVWKINVNNLTFTHFFTDTHNGKLISIMPVNNKMFFASSVYTSNPFNITSKTFPDLILKSVSLGKSGIIAASHKELLLCRPSGAEEVIWQGRTTCAIEKDNGFYIGTLNGLFHKSYSGKTLDLGALFPVIASRIVNLAVSDDGILWITTKGNGVVGYANNKILYHLTEKDGLTSDNCTSMYIDGNILWLGTGKGLNKIDISRRNKITQFSMSDGLPSDAINAIEVSGNKVFVGSPKGLTYFEVDKISQTSTCDLQLTGIYLNNKYWRYDSTNFSLPHKNNDIRFEFSGISFKSAGEMTFKYRLLGLQREWRTTTENQLSFPSLSSGEYTLQLKVINKYGVESKTKEVSFVIGKLLWERLWFKIIMVLLFAGGVWSYINYRTKRIRRNERDKAEINNRIAELEQKALRAQMNPHFIFNCLNSIQQYVAERDITGANNFITDFSRLIRMTLDLSTQSLINLSDEVDYIGTYLRIERARLEYAFDYCINIDESLDLREVVLPPLLLQPYIENSIRHGIRYRKRGDGLIQVNIGKENQGVLISIEDNGIGREAARKYKSEYHIQYQSRGMTINEDRIKILNAAAKKKIDLRIADLYNANSEAAGTRVDIYLP